MQEEEKTQAPEQETGAEGTETKTPETGTEGTGETTPETETKEGESSERGESSEGAKE